jgi:hypothetical protein
MSPERQGRLRAIALTALVTCGATLAAVYAFAIVSRRPPPTPQLAPPKTITVTLYPCNNWSMPGCPPTQIPAGDFEQVMRLLTPGQYYEGGINDWITPLIAEVVIAHEGQPETRLLVRWSGKNPALLSVDGKHYFYGQLHDGIYDGGLQLAALAQKLAEAKSP